MPKPSRADIVSAARGYLGIPWKHQGRNRQRALDCAGLVIVVAQDLSLSEFDTQDYVRNTIGHTFLRYFRREMDEKSVNDVLPGDVMLFRDDAYACHSTIVGINAQQELTLIHAMATRRKVVEEALNEQYWKPRRVACFSFKGITD